MQVLVKNPFSPSKPEAKNVIESFWGSDCLYLGAAFSMSSLMDPSEAVGLSPFLVLDAKIAFLISQMNVVDTTYARRLGPLGLVGAKIKTGSRFVHEEDQKKLSLYTEEYLLKDNQELTTQSEQYDQVADFGSHIIDQDLWKKLKIGGFYLIASDKNSIQIDLEHEEFEAFGKRWPFGGPTEFGWRFKEEEWGLNNYEFAKIRKLS